MITIRRLASHPPLVFHGFKCVSESEALLINIPTEAYNYSRPDEYRVPPHDNDIPYDWNRKDGLIIFSFDSRTMMKILSNWRSRFYWI